MTPNPALGVFLHAVGGFAAGSFYAPLKRIKRWSWESYWLVMGLAAWVAAPWTVALYTTPELFSILQASPASAWKWCISFGILWGLGNLTFGLSVRYLGMALGYSIALGFCMVFGTLVPPIYHGLTGNVEEWEKMILMFTSTSGQIVLGGIGVCLAGIAMCGWAGICKESDLKSSEEEETVREFSLGKGFAVAAMAGILSSCFAFGLAAGEDIAKISVKHGTDPIFKNNAVLVVVLIGGFLSNAIWCLILNLRNRSFKDYVSGSPSGQLTNSFLAMFGGVIWYGQFFFYGMGTTKLGEDYDFSSWSIHMAFIIVFSNLWGLVFREWKGTRVRTKLLVWFGILTLIGSTVVIGMGNYLAD